MDNQDSKCSSQVIALAFLGGAVAGVVAGLLLAPKSGEETRGALKGYTRRAEEEVWRRRRRHEPPLMRPPSVASISSQRKRRMSRLRPKPDERP